MLFKRFLNKDSKATLGAVERVSLPDLGIKNLLVRVDTGASLSALHAENIHYKKIDGVKHVFFDVAVGDKGNFTYIPAKARVKLIKKFVSSNGITTKRPVIDTKIKIGRKSWRAKVSLIDRSNMNYRMLLGRSSLRGKFIVDVSDRFIFS